ncbi:MAG: membrane protein insertase YidC [Propionibacteriaceae bacterium]|nr:membrane protein insertase YidC [Propionibacteriaceae bacterium]
MNLLEPIPMLVPLDLWSDIAGGFNWIMTPLYWLISGLLVLFHSFFALFISDAYAGWSWALSIVLLTMLVRTCLIPMFVKQINSTRNMQIMQPKIKELQDKYKDDKERLQREQMALYQSEGINPMASCMPILFQMPVFMALFWVLNSLRTSPLGYWLETNPELVESLRDGELFGAHLSNTLIPIPAEGWGATQTLATIMITLMVACLFTTQLQVMRKNMPPAAQTGPMAQQQKIMLFMFPVMYAFGGANIPIGVLVYWLTTNLWTLVQQSILVHNNPSPGTPAFLDWEDRMRAKGLDPDAIVEERRAKMRKKVKEKKNKKPVPEAPQITTTPGTKKVVPTRGKGGSGQPGAPRPATPAKDADGNPIPPPGRQQRRKTSRAKRKS